MPARFQQEGQRLTVSRAVDRLMGELERLRAKRIIISTNLIVNRDGTPRSGQPEPQDPGVAVYFHLKEKRTSLACDKWTRVADNIAALAAHIYCLRGIERYGVGTLEQAFRGYQALPAPGFVHHWREVLGDCRTREQAQAVFREKAKRLHPDQGGDATQMAELNLAIKDALGELQ